MSATRCLLVSVVSAFGLAAVGSATAQQWTVDPAASNAWADGEVYADRGCNNDPAGGGPPVVCPPPPPGLAALMAPPPEDCFQRPLGTCPPFLQPCDFLHPFILPPWAMDAARECINGLAADFVFAGPGGFQVWDFGVYAAATARDHPPVDPLGFCANDGWAESGGRSRLLVEGVGTQTLEIRFGAEVDQRAQDAGEGFFTRGCLGVRGTIAAAATGLPPSQSFIRFDHVVIGAADTGPDCLVAATGPICALHPLPPAEDFGTSSVFMSLDFGAGPFVLRDTLLAPYDPINPTAAVATPGWSHGVVALPPQASSFPLEAVLRADSDLTTSWPPQSFLTDDDDEAAAFDGQLWLYLISHDFTPGEPLDQYMRLVPVTGVGQEGPTYPFRMGRHEITNQQYANFLNSADLDGGQTGLGSHMAFNPLTGAVTTTDGVSLMFDPGTTGSRIVFTPGAPVGTRYTVARPVGADPRSYERHPVTGVSWLGAVKFCNWLTLKTGLGPGERCYTEGQSLADWHPVTISTADWIARDLDANERQQLVAGYRGYRLPMDGIGTALGPVSSQPGAYNEWYKAAAHDPTAPAVTRVDPGGALVPAYHWTFGFGRDLLLPGDANYFNSLDPFDNDDAFVGFYDGSLHNPGGSGAIGDGTQIQTTALANPWGIHDLTGNVDEWVQDRTWLGLHFAVRGGSWATPAVDCAATRRTSLPATTTDGRTGFRVVRSELSPGTCWSDGFDQYQQGWLAGQGGWEPWNGDPQAAGFTVDPGAVSSPPYALEIDGADDAVRRFSGFGGSGDYRFHARMLVPLAMSDEQDLILLNAYPATALRDWSLQLAIDGQNDVFSDHDAPASNLPLVRDSWVDVRVVVDLDADVQRVFYDGQPLLEKSWTSGVAPGGALDIAAVDLWGNGSAYPVRYDDLRLDTCVSDIDGDGVVDVDDLIIVILDWGCAGTCIGDVTLDGTVGVDDLVQVIVDFGPCDC